MSSQVSLNSTGSQLVSNDTNTSNYILNTSNFLQQNINTKQSIITGGASSIITNDLTTGMVLVSDGSGKVSTHETITSDKLTFLDGVTSSIQTQLNSKEPSFTVLGLSKGGIGTTSISANTILGATTANTVSTISLGTGLSITGSTLNASSIALFSLANNYIDLNMTNTYTNIIKESFDTAIVKYNNNYNITNNSNFLIKNILNFNNNYILQQSDYIDTVNYNNIVKVACSQYNMVFLENTGKVLANGVNSTLQGMTGTRTTNGVVYVSEYVFGINGLGTQMTGIINIICSDYHTVFLENTGKVLACGYNSSTVGITGTRATNSSTIYIPEYVLAPGGSNQMTGIVNIACSSYSTLFIENTLKIIACGYNISTGTNGQGLTGTRVTNGTVYIPEYVLAPGGSNQMTGIVNMVCAEQHTVYLENTGRVLACGYNNNNNANGLGITGTRVTNGTVYVPEYVLGIGGTGTQMTGIVNIVCGLYHTVFLENTGNVLACGRNAVPSGITGTRTTQGIEYVAKYVLGIGGTTGPQMTGIVNIACSLSHTVYLENTGKVLASGYNNNNNAGSGITGTRTTNTIEYVAQYVLGIGGTTGPQMTGIVNIACSDRHTIFLENTGKVLSCGQNSSTAGITGTLTTTGVVYTPQYVLGTNGLGTQMTGIANIVCSTINTVFLENTGRALACGANNAGFGITGTRTTAGVVYVSQYVIYTQNMFKNYLNIDTTYYNNIQKIVCAGYHTVFLENTGKVLACGDNSSDGYGYGITGTTTILGTIYVPQYVLGTIGLGTQMTGIINIVCAYQHTVFLENTGKVLACGYNNANGYGITGTRATNGTVYVPEYVLKTIDGITTQMTGIVNMVCSNYHTVFLENTGKVLACGNNDGITGTATKIGTIYIPEYVLGIGGMGTQMTGIVNIVCSDRHTVFLENTGKVLACGQNSSSTGITGTRITNGVVNISEYVLAPGGTGQMTGIINIACSDYHTVFLENTGKVLACGLNSTNTGITGTRITDSSTIYIPEYVLAPGGSNQMTGIVNIACSQYNTVYLENTGKVLACGYNSTTSGITGTRATNGTVYVSEYVLKTIDGITTQMTGIINIACSDYNTVYLENTGKVLACGYNTYGVGITGTRSTNGIVYVPEYVLGTNGGTSQMTGIISIACSEYHTVYLENTGKTLACGLNNNYGEGITGTQNTSGVVYIPQYVIYTQNLFKNYIKNAINGNNCIFAITDTNNVIANYDNTYGKLGTGYPGYNYNNFVINYTGSGNLSGVTKIACGLYHTVFLLNTNTAYSCGFNIYGQLGITSTRTTIPTAITNGTFVSNIACGLYHTILLSGTTAKSCGLNNYGQLGLNDNTNRLIISDITLANVSDIDCGEYFTVLKVGTTVYSTGLNDKGQLGVGDTTNKIVPTQVLAINNAGGTITNVNLIKCTKNNIIFLLFDNTIAVCGNNINNIYNSNVAYYTFPSLIKSISEIKTNISTIYTNIYTDEIYIKTS